METPDLTLNEFDEFTDITFTELIRPGVRTQNSCICRDNVLSSKERKTVLAAIKEDKKLYKKLKKVFNEEN